MGSGLSRSLSPTMRQEFFEPRHRMFCDATEHVSEPGKRIDPDQFTGRNKTAQPCRSLSAIVASEEGPVIPTHREASQRPLRGVVVDRQIAVRTVASQRRPVLQRVRNSLSRVALRQYLLPDRQKVIMQLIEHRARILFPCHSQLFSAQPVLTRHLLHSIKMRDHRQYSAHARPVVLQRVMKMAAIDRPRDRL